MRPKCSTVPSTRASQSALLLTSPAMKWMLSPPPISLTAVAPFSGSPSSRSPTAGGEFRALLGWRRDVSELLHASDLILHTSLWEGLPQVFPQFADVTMYRWEYNFRASTVMGMVGAGGIGTELIGSLRLLDYQQVGAILIVILVAVTIVDTLSNLLRKAFT